MNKETSSRVSSIAANVLAFKPVTGPNADEYNYLLDMAQTLAGSALSQDETPGPGPHKIPDGIHPAPTEFTPEQITTDPILQFFHYAHLPPALRPSSSVFCQVASWIVNVLPRNAERTVALRKLLEAKDAAVRANLPAPKLGEISDFKTTRVASEDEIGEPVEVGGHDEDRDGPIPFDN